MANAQELILVRRPRGPFPTCWKPGELNPRRPALVLDGAARQKINTHCFRTCVPKPGSRLDSSETVGPRPLAPSRTHFECLTWCAPAACSNTCRQTCLAKCMDRYMDAWNVVARVYANRLQNDGR